MNTNLIGITRGVSEIMFVKCFAKFTLERSTEGKAEDTGNYVGIWVDVVVGVRGSSHCFNFLIEVGSKITI